MPRPKYTVRDLNHGQIVRECRELGMVVWDLADLGGQILDLMIFWRGKCLPVEVKQPGKRACLTEGEKESLAALEAIGVQAAVVTSIEDVISEFEKSARLCITKA
jgi:hypothetical protein